MTMNRELKFAIKVAAIIEAAIIYLILHWLGKLY